MIWAKSTLTRFEEFGTDPRRLKYRGLALLIVGACLAFASLLNPNASLMHATEFSWLPASGFVLLIVGFSECFDALIAKNDRDFFVHLPVGLLDVSVGILTIFSINGKPDRLGLLLAAFMINKGIWRMIAAYGTNLPHRRPVLIGAWFSVILGILIGIVWPKAPAWFLSASLNIDFILRGWALVVLAGWVQAQKERCQMELIEPDEG